MKPADNINKSIKKLHIEPTAEMDKRIHNGISMAIRESKQKTPASNKPDRWRIIMNKPIIKFAVATVVIIAVMLGTHAITGSFDGSTKVYAMSDLPSLVYSARTIHMKGTAYHADNSNPGRVIPSDIEILVDLENERWRRITSNVSIDENGMTITPTESILDGGEFQLFLNKNDKTASYTRLGNFGRKRICRQSANSVLFMTCGKEDFWDLYKVVGQEQIDGQIYEIWELLIENPDSMAMNIKMRSWLSPETGDVDHAIIWNKINGDWVKMADITMLDLNVDVADESFQMYVPDGYELTNTMETAHENSIGGVTCGTGNFYLSGHILFAMEDGSMIACWSSRKNKGSESQAEIFTKVEFGGELPKLPSVIEHLKTSYDGREVIYDGYHLGYTKKKNRFYEWSLYVAADPIEHRMSHILPYELLYKTNGKEDASCRLNLRADMKIENADDFNDFILGAMAELSDDGMAPEDITYRAVQELTEQIRSSIE